MKRKLGNFLILFVVFILLGTIISRAATNYTLAKVELVRVEEGIISHDIETKGIVTGKNKRAIILDEGLVIESVQIAPGQTVNAGDEIFTINIAKLDEEIQKKREEIQKLEYQIQDAVSDRKINNQKVNKQYSNAMEEYQYVVANEQSKVEAARQSLEAAQTTCQAYISSVNAEKAECERLLAEVQQKEEAYSLAVETMETSIHAAENAVENLDTSLSQNSTAEQLTIDKADLTRQLDKLVAIQVAQGIVRATVSGTIEEILVETGVTTTGEAVARFIDEADTKEVRVEVSQEQADYVSLGSEVKLTNHNQKEESGVVREISAKKENPGVYQIVIEIAGDVFDIRESVVINIKNSNNKYECTIPIEALRMESENKYYVYQLIEKDTINGNELEVFKMNVKVLDKNEEMVAVEGVAASQEVIVASDKVIQEGSKVKLKGE